MARDTCLAVNSEYQSTQERGRDRRSNLKSLGQRQALYSEIEGSSCLLLRSPLLNIVPLPPPTEYSCACVKIWWRSSIPLSTPQRTDSRLFCTSVSVLSSYIVFSILYFHSIPFLFMLLFSHCPPQSFFYLIFVDVICTFSNMFVDIVTMPDTVAI